MLVDHLVDSGTTPGHDLFREELRQRVQEALRRLTPPDSEILVMRYLEDLSFPEIAEILGMGESAAKMRHLRAIEKIRLILTDNDSGLVP
jgi:RNA polymerase sigma-70 factor (ECF subfamily)